MKLTWQRSETLFTLALVLVLFGALVHSLGWSQRAGLFPWIVLVPTLALAVWQLVDDARGETKPPTTVVGDQGEAEELDADMTSGEMARRGAHVVAWIFGFFAAIWLIGFGVGGGIVSALYLRFDWRESWRTSIIYGVIVFLLLELLFRELLNIPFEPGFIFDLLNIELRLRWW